MRPLLSKRLCARFGVVTIIACGAVAGCSGSSAAPVDPGTDGGGTDSGGADAGRDAPPPGDCDDQLDEIGELRKAAIVCDPRGIIPPCTQEVQDVCCPATVSDRTSPAARRLEAAVKQFREAGCSAFCTEGVCKGASRQCITGSSDKGMCKQ
ncbi:hypothetical protein [Pendulispora albinea]|uniref:Secreted protein n=1 Tax=Pendulispora albinea TaxID=2741071 RepID=A0ABZ2LUN6_9BACT